MTRRTPSSRCSAVLLALAVLPLGAAAWLLGAADELAPARARGDELAPANRTPIAASNRTGDRADATQPLGCYGAPVGSRFVHRVSDRADYRVVGPQTGAQPAGSLHGECRLLTTVLARRSGEVLVEYRLADLQFLGADGRAIEDAVQQSFVAAAATAVFARLDERGSVRGYGFAEGIDGDQRNFLRGMLATVAFAAPANDPSWTADEADTTGDYEARYEVLPAAGDGEVAVRRTRLRYRTMAANAEVPAHELRGAATARFSTRLGWLESAHIDEGLTMALPLLELKSASDRRVEVALESVERVDVAAGLELAWASATSPVCGSQEAVGRFAAASERRRWSELLRGVTLDQLLAELAMLAPQPANDEKVDALFQRLQWLAKLDDAVAREIGDRVASRAMRGEVAGFALSSLGAAGTPAAQAVLATVRADRSLAADVRGAATIATLQLAQPTAELVQGLASDAGDDFDGRQGALLVLGALAPRAQQPLADGRSPLAALLAMEADARARGDVATWLLAVGNAAPPQTVAIAQRYLDDADTAVRAAACTALRRVAGAEALALLVDRGAADGDAGVRREAMLALSRRSEVAARAALQQMALHDPDETLRTRAGQLLQSGA